MAFALTALLLSTSLAIAAYALVRRAVVNDRENQAVRQSYTNARAVRNGLRANEPDVPRVLEAIQVGAGGGSILRDNGQWYTTSVDLDRRVLPPELVEALSDGRAGRQTVDIKGRPFVVAGVPIRETDAIYFELMPLGDVEAMLDLLARSLLTAGMAATAIGGLAGALTSGAVLRPVRRMANVARRIVEGDLDERLEADGDPDLQPLVESFNEMLDDLRDRIQREARFASDVTHELRGPLATLSAAVDVVNRRRDQLPERAVEAVDALASQVESFNALVLDLLEISRFDAGAAQVERRSIDLPTFVRAVLDDEKSAAEVRVNARDAATTALEADPRRLHQILANLIQNARRYAGGETAVIVDVDVHTARISVEDSGPGVADEEKDAIFGRFARGAAAEVPGAPRGTGLGLALVAEHAALHGGRVWVEDRDGGGARFVVELPVAS